MPRRVRLVVCSRSGHVLGALPEFAVESPWWPDVEPVVKGALDHFGVDVIVLRLLTAGNDSDVMGGDVSYLAERFSETSGVIGGRAALAPARADEAARARNDHALRAPWARPGGVHATIEWADTELVSRRTPRIGPPLQVKSWNLSSILRLRTPIGDVWSKSVPPFMAHEEAILRMIGTEHPALVPRVVASQPAHRTVLLEQVPGEDLFEASRGQLALMVNTLVDLQARWAERIDQLLSAGLPDWRGPSMVHLARALLRRSEVRNDLQWGELALLDALVADLPRRFAALHACGLPDTLVHGDFHPGNWRSDGDRLVLLDWGDSGVGHPLLDLAAFASRITDEVRLSVLAVWFDAWRSAQPRCDPSAAWELIEPIAALRQAIVYQRFLDGIEPSERLYHASDVPRWLRRAASAAT